MRMMKNLAAIAALSMASLLSTTLAAAGTKAVDREVSEALKAVTVRTHLVEKLGVDALGISVTVSDETATLSGHVAKAASKGLAEEVALSVDGIKKVENKVTENVPPGAAAATEAAVKNASLELKVKSILLGDIGTHALKIEVEAVNGVVSLRGKLDSPEAARSAVRKVKAIKGVKKVVDLLG